MGNKFTMKAFRLLFALLLVSGTVSAQSWEQPYAGRGFTVQDTVICGRRAVFVVPPQAIASRMILTVLTRMFSASARVILRQFLPGRR